MRKPALGVGFVVVLSASGAMAQGQVAVIWNCPKPTLVHSIEAGDRPNHVYSISQVKCTAAKGEIAGVQQKEGVGTEFHEITGAADRFQGTFVETLANGGQIIYKYEGTATIKDGQFVETTSHKWWSLEGTGAFKGIKSEGTCQGAAKPDGNNVFDCSGTYSMTK